MYHEYSDSLKRMPDSEIKYINKVLKENCTDHHFDIILIKHRVFIHAFIVTDVDTIEKAKPNLSEETLLFLVFHGTLFGYIP